MRSWKVWGVGVVVVAALAVTGVVRAEKTPPKGGGAAPAVPTVQLPGVPTSPLAPSAGANPKEVEAAADAVCDNWGFERGLTCWTDASATRPSAFASQPTIGDNVVAGRVMRQMELSAGGIGGDYWKNVPYPIGGVKKNASPAIKTRYQSQAWIGTFENRPTASARFGTSQGDGPQGELRSKPFRVKSRFLSFLLAGGKNANVGVALQVPGYLASKVPVVPGVRRYTTNDGWVEVAVAKGNDSEVMRRHVWDLQTVLGLAPDAFKDPKFIARVSIFDFDSGAWGHVSVDDFLFGGTPPPTIALVENGVTIARDVDHPVWGFADTHAHPTHQIGFGGKTIGGDTDGPMSTALATSKCTDIHGGVLRVLGGRNHQHAAIGAVDEHLPDGYPTFIGWPTYRSKFHQTQHVDWLRRAFDGGQRLIVALGVTNMFWATRGLGPGVARNTPVDDETVALQQLQMMRDIVARQSSWMEIATSPDHARRIIHQNKLAVVLGVESDNFGNFKDASYTWQDVQPAPSRPLVALPADKEAARAVIRQKIESYYANNLIRQVTPLHYISGVFGGTAVFRGQFALIQENFTGKRYDLRNATPQEGVAYNLWKDWSGFQAFLGMGARTTPDHYVNCVDDPRTALPRAVVPAPQPGFACVSSSVNAVGLTPRGEVLIEELMRRGMLVDTEHSSAPSAATMGVIARRYGYPLMSSHSDVRELSFVPRSGKRWSGDAKADLTEFGTTQIGNLTHEAMLGTAGFETVKATGGTAGVITMAYRKRGYPNDGRPYVPNDCDGSTKTYAQSYLYAVDKLDGQGVALATDRGFTDFIGPRFGTHAAYRLRDESLDELRVSRRWEQKRAQSNGVRYDVPFKFFHPARFEFGDTTLEEEDAWKAMAYWEAKQTSPLDARYAALPASEKIPASSHVGHGGRIESLVRGLAATNESQLRDCCGDTPFEEAAMLAAKQGKTPEQFVAASTRPIFRNNVAAIRRVWNDVQPVYRLWSAMKGTNQPLRKRIDGVRDWDVNIDGVAHYGMLPDMIQDMANIGVTPEQLAPLFGSAEDYILMWERAEAARGAVR